MRLFVLSVLSFCASALGAKKPNIILFFTDDQSVNTLAKREYMPKTFEHLVDRGTFFANFFAPVSVCCPSRVSLLRSQAAHSHNVTFVAPPWGGYEVYNSYGYNGHALPDFLQQSGYNTYYIGKLMNEHTVDNCDKLPVSGFTGSDFLVDPHTYDYWSPAFSHDNGPAEFFPGQYSTDLVKERSLKRLDEGLATSDESPFFLAIATSAPHSWISALHENPDKGYPTFDIPAAHPRHQRLFPTEQAPRDANWNKKGGVSWVANLPELNVTEEAYIDEFFRGRLRALQSVDEIVEEVVRKVEAAGELDNTFFFYSADNGYSMGAHRRQPSKTLNFEDDIHVPFIARGPGIKEGFVNTKDSHGIVDLGATILHLAGATADYIIDGQPIPLAEGSTNNTTHSHTEYWVIGADEGVYAGPPRLNNTYRNTRVHEERKGGNLSYSYAVWCTGERQLYDLDKDPHQVDNLLEPLNKAGPFTAFHATDAAGKPILSEDLQRLLLRLDALTLVLKTCTGSVCTHPYRSLFPDALDQKNEVASLSQALHPKFDAYFASLPRVQYSKCELGYHTRIERPFWDDKLAYREHGRNLVDFRVQPAGILG